MGDGEKERGRLCTGTCVRTHSHVERDPLFFSSFFFAHMCMSGELLCQAGDTSHVNRF